MRILLHSINFAPEVVSTGKYAGEMAEWLAQRGHHVRVVTTPPHYPQWRISEGYSGIRSTHEERVLSSGCTGKLEIFRCPVWVPAKLRGCRAT
jgi:colanic acid biosynthesis glycosyl transferase WcaI